jgi:methionyl-tRNA formyltransferase
VSRIKAAFFGTPVEAIPILSGLLAVADVGLVVTRPDAPRGRSKDPVPPAVKVTAKGLGLRVLQPERPVEVLDEVASLDVVVLAAYGLLIPGPLLEAPEHGFLNIHYSLLPRWRGASPVVRAILAGDEQTGVTLMRMDEGLDTGPILAVCETPIDPEETAGELTARLAALGGDLVEDVLADVIAGRRVAEPQDDGGATAAGKVEVDEAFLDPRRHTADAVHRAVRAFNPKPGAWGMVDAERIKVWRARRHGSDDPPADHLEPGTAALAHSPDRSDRVLLACADGPVVLTKVQRQGRAAMDAGAWLNGRQGEPAVFESG